MVKLDLLSDLRVGETYLETGGALQNLSIMSAMFVGFEGRSKRQEFWRRLMKQRVEKHINQKASLCKFRGHVKH